MDPRTDARARRRPARPVLLTTAVLAVLGTGVAAGCAVADSQALGSAEPAGAAPATSPAASPTSPSASPTGFAVPARQSGELGRVVRDGRTRTTVGSTTMAVGKVYRLTASCVRAPSGRLTVVLLDGEPTAEAKAVTTFDVRCDGSEHPVDFQVATPARAGLRLTGTGDRTRAWATVVDAGRNGVCGCS